MLIDARRIGRKYGPSSSANGFRLLSVKNLAWILPLVFALVYAAHAAYLWRMYGPPNGRSFATTVMNFYSFDEEGKRVNDVAAVGIAGILQGIGAMGGR